MAKSKSRSILKREIADLVTSSRGRAEEALLPGSDALWIAAQASPAARGNALRKWSKEDKAEMRTVLEYVRRSYKVPGAIFPRLIPLGMGGVPEIVCGPHHVATFSTFEHAAAAESIARQAAEACGLPIG